VYILQFLGKKEKRDHDSFNQELFPEFGFVNLNPAGSVLAFSILELLHIHVMILSGSLIQKLFSKDGIRVAIGKSILQSPTVI
jgi:hypothetical protein